MTVFNDPDWQVMEIQEVLCPRGSKAQGRFKPRHEGYEGYEDVILH